MKKTLQIAFLIFFIICSMQSISQESAKATQYNVIYYGTDYFLLEGTAIPDSLKVSRYDRFPASYKQKVREVVWELSKHSAGISIRFFSNTSSINLKWTVLNDGKMNHMPATGIKGVDLYFNNNGIWQYLNTAKPKNTAEKKFENQFLLMSNMTSEMREYKMFLPLYDGLVSIEIGIDSNSVIKKSVASNKKPIVFYGTSITQGGCASRPGMAHTNIISRKLDVECINFGFSGNGKMEQPIVELIAEIDASFFVIECLPNMSTEEVTERTIPLIKILRNKHPHTPIVLVENFEVDYAYLNKTVNDNYITKNIALKNQFNSAIKEEYKNIFYIEKDNAIGNDHEATVDGLHFTDLGFMRYADFLISKFNKFGLKIDSYK